MRNKILIVTHDSNERNWFEQQLQAIVEAGGEIFFSEKFQDAEKILKKERPQLAFVDKELWQNVQDWESDDVHIVILQQSGDSPVHDSLLKPLSAEKVLDKCRQYLNQEKVEQVPPM
jgi:DNA-binding NtrC family response regulator